MTSLLLNGYGYVVLSNILLNFTCSHSTFGRLIPDLYMIEFVLGGSLFVSLNPVTFIKML